MLRERAVWRLAKPPNSHSFTLGLLQYPSVSVQKNAVEGAGPEGRQSGTEGASVDCDFTGKLSLLEAEVSTDSRAIYPFRRVHCTGPDSYSLTVARKPRSPIWSTSCRCLSAEVCEWWCLRILVCLRFWKQPSSRSLGFHRLSQVVAYVYVDLTIGPSLHRAGDSLKRRMRPWTRALPGSFGGSITTLTSLSPQKPGS